MTCLAIRHLPTRLNREGILQGRLDEPILAPDAVLLSAVEHNKRALVSREPFERVLASPLRRTQQTAEIYGYEATVEPLLEELDFGPYEGRLRADLFSKVPAWRSDPAGVVLGEPVAALEARVRRFIERYGHHERVLVFGHGVWLRALCAVVREGDIRSMNTFTLDNNALLSLEL